MAGVHRLRVAGAVALAIGIAYGSPVGALADAKITASGSTALLPLVKACAASYQVKNPSVQIEVAAGGSATGINQVANKAVDIGDSDIPAKNHPELVDHRVAVTGFAIITNPGLGLRGLTKKQARDIFAGDVSNWKDVGGPDQTITVINRPRSSGTRAVFTRTVMDGTPVADSGLTEDATGTVVATVSTTPGAISYAAFSGTHGKLVTELTFDGVAPTEANVSAGKYPIWSYEHMYTNGAPSTDVSKFIQYVTANSDALKKLQFIAVKEMKVSENDR